MKTWRSSPRSYFCTVRLQAGWSSERLFRLLVDQMNTVENAKGTNGPTPGLVPAYEDFKRVAFLLRRLELENLVSGAMYMNQPVLGFEPAARDRAEYVELTRILGLDPDKLIFPVVVAARGGSADSINLRFRSFAGVMYFLSQSVQVPEEDIAAGRVTVTEDATGQTFDWQQVTQGLLTIKSSSKRPEFEIKLCRTQARQVHDQRVRWNSCMAEIFLSCAAEDRERMRPLVASLEAEGRNLWWDRQIKPGEARDREIDEAIHHAS